MHVYIQHSSFKRKEKNPKKNHNGNIVNSSLSQILSSKSSSTPVPQDLLRFKRKLSLGKKTGTKFLSKICKKRKGTKFSKDIQNLFSHFQSHYKGLQLIIIFSRSSIFRILNISTHKPGTAKSVLRKCKRQRLWEKDCQEMS